MNRTLFLGLFANFLLLFASKTSFSKHIIVVPDQGAESVLLFHGNSNNDSNDDDDDDDVGDDDDNKASAIEGSYFTDPGDVWDLLRHTNLGKQDTQDEGKSISGASDLAVIILVPIMVIAFLMYQHHTMMANVKSSTRKKNKNYENASPPSFSHLTECDMEGTSVRKLFVSSKVIAKGSNGTVVFEGTYDGRKVAVKRLVMAHQDVAFEERDNLTASDHHPNIVRLFGWEYDRDFIYLSLERCACNLYELIQYKRYSESFQLWRTKDYPRPKVYPSPILLDLMRDIVTGLVHLHELRIIHRDLKPHNVLIVKGKILCAKLSDMGISRRLVGDMSSLGHHASGSGSSGWQAPEQLLGGRQTRAMDVFSLGSVLFFCITGGRHPFGNHYERDANVAKNLKDLSLVKHIPEALDLLVRLLNPNPELRPKASDVLHHPMFWSSDTRMSFLRDTSDWVESEARRVGSIVLRELERKGSVVFDKKWNEKMESAFISNIRQYRRYDYKSVRDLLRVIRNTLNHYRDFTKENQELLGSVPEGLDDYFRSRFPKLLMKVYNVVYLNCKQEEWFRKYL